jgi:hypothetical protein
MPLLTALAPLAVIQCALAAPSTFHSDWVLLASRHEFSDRCAEWAFAVVETFNSGKVVFGFLDQQFSAESMSLACLVVFRCQPSYFRCFLGTARDNEWRTGGRDVETRALMNNHFMGQLQSRLQIGIWQSAKIVDTADGDAAFDHVVGQAVLASPVRARKHCNLLPAGGMPGDKTARRIGIVIRRLPVQPGDQRSTLSCDFRDGDLGAERVIHHGNGDAITNEPVGHHIAAR